MEAEAVREDSLQEPIAAFLDHLKVERSASLHTVSAYRNDLERAEKAFRSQGLSRWCDLSNHHLEAYEASLAKGIRKSTAQRRLSSLRSFLKYLARNGVPVQADLPATGGFRKPKTLPKALSETQLSGFMEAKPITTPQGLRDRALFELIYGAGLRVSEAVELESSAIDLKTFTIRIFGKRGKTRINPLPEITVEWLKAYLEFSRPQLVKIPIKHFIVSDRGKPLLRQTAYKLVEKFRLGAGLAKGVSPHTLRHTFAVDMLKHGADLRVVQELLGLGSIATTHIYTQLDMAEVRKRYDQAHPRR